MKIESYIPNHIPQTLAIKLKAKGENYVRQGHPWIFESSITKISKEGKAGDIAIIFSTKKNKFLGLGIYDPHSPIRIKVLAHGEKATLNETWFRERISEAYLNRQSLLKKDVTGYRLIFGENDRLPGVICDVYSNVVVIKIYATAWLPYLHFLVNSIIETISVESIILRLSRNVQIHNEWKEIFHDGQILFGSLDNPEIEFSEYGVRFIANVIKGHKTGYFLDHRHNRRKVGQMAHGKSVLDVFSYAGGFSVHTVAGGAREVVSIDISAHALALAERNVRINKENANHKIMAMDAFQGMQSLIDQGKKFDIVVVDPPSFAKQAADINKAKHSYARLAKLAIQLTEYGGTCVMASCSSRVEADDFFTLIENAFDDSKRSYRLIEKTFHDIDHPINFAEGAYLKTGYYSIS